MIMSQKIAPEHILLISRYFDGTITVEETQHLEKLLKEDPSIRSLYFEYVKLNFALHQIGELQSVMKKTTTEYDSLLLKLAEHEKTANTVEIEIQNLSYSCIPVQMRKAEKPKRKIITPTFNILIASLAASILFFVLIFFLPPRKYADTVAEIKYSPGAKWTQPYSKNRRFLYQGPLHVAQGNLEINMFDGTALTIIAPADIVLEQVDKVLLQQGSLRAVVPPAAVGFIVRTPSGSVVDYGTEFELDVDSNGTTYVKVVKGTIDLRDNSNPFAFNNAQKLTAGSTGRISPAGEITYEFPKASDSQTIFSFWQCDQAVGKWLDRKMWSSDILRNPSLDSAIIAEKEKKTVLIGPEAIGLNKIIGLRICVGVTCKNLGEVIMDGGQVYLEQLWVGRGYKENTGNGQWILNDGEIVLESGASPQLIVGDVAEGRLEINGGSISANGGASFGISNGHGVVVMNKGAVSLKKSLEIGISGGNGLVEMNGGQIHASELTIENGKIIFSGGTMVLDGDARERIQSYRFEGKITAKQGGGISSVYDQDNTYGFGKNKTLVSVQ